jgi:DNA mismatch endonuclease (patch repair protein)
MDTVSKKTRSQIMAKVHSRNNTSTERRLRSSLVGAGISGFRLNVEELPGKPDFAFFTQKVAIFVDGCFWHGCPSCYRRPHTSRKYWDEKVSRNIDRDKKTTRDLKNMGWLTIRIWEHSLTSLPKVRKKVQIALQF